MTERPIGDRDGPRDECGVFGVYAPGHDVARLAYFSLYALQHRGQESAGIATCEGGHITTLRDLGLVSQVFDEEKLRALAGRHGDRPRALLDDGRRRVGERPAGVALGRPRGRARPQRQPDQRRRALQRAARAGPRVPRHVRLGDHGRAAVHARRQDDRGRRRRDDAAAARRLLDGRDDQARRRRVPRPARGPAAVAGPARRPLRGRLGELRLRHHRRQAAARGRPGRDGLADRGRPRRAPGGRLGALGVLRVRAHLLLAPRHPPRGPRPAAGARQDGRDPLGRGARPTPTS